MNENSNNSSEVTLKAVNDNLLVEPIEEEKKSDIYISDVAEKPTPKARVISAGPGRPLADGTLSVPPAKEGDVILYNPGLVPYELAQGKKKLLAINALSVLAIYASN